MEHHYSIFYKPVNALLGSVGLYLPDHVIMALFVTMVTLIVFPLMARGISRENPGWFQQAMEMLIGGLKNLIDDIVGHGTANRYLTMIIAFTVFIFLSNICGLFFFLQPPTGNPNTTFGLALTAFLYYNWIGLRKQGPVHYLAHFAGPIWWLAPLMFPIEIIGHFARILSLGMRLFGNVFGEHTATGIFMGLMPLIVPWPMMGIGIFQATLQTFVFIMLTMVYIGGAVAAEEH